MGISANPCGTAVQVHWVTQSKLLKISPLTKNSLILESIFDTRIRFLADKNRYTLILAKRSRSVTNLEISKSIDSIQIPWKVHWWILKLGTNKYRYFIGIVKIIVTVSLNTIFFQMLNCITLCLFIWIINNGILVFYLQCILVNIRTCRSAKRFIKIAKAILIIIFISSKCDVICNYNTGINDLFISCYVFNRTSIYI